MDIAPSDNSTAEAQAYLNEILAKVNKYMRTRSVWKQDELKYALNRIINKGSGEYCCLLGGANTGKSLVLAELTRNSNQSVVRINMRLTSSILRGLICSFNQGNSAVFDAALLEVVKSLPSRFSVTDSLVRLGVSLDPEAMLAHYIGDKQGADFVKLYKLLSVVAKKSPKNAAGCGLTLIIDQANIAFTDRWGEDARDTLSIFVALTKQEHLVSCFMYSRVYLTFIVLCACCQVNVILVSSGDYTFPDSLRCPGFSSRDFTRYIFTSEVSQTCIHI